jgi:general secretion pathway protein C
MLHALDSDSLGRRSPQLARIAVALALAAAGAALLRLLWLLAWGPTLPDTAAVTLGPAPESVQASAQSVANWHLFGNAAGPIDLAALAQAAPATGLRLTLRGTLNENAPEGGVAIIADESGVDRAYRVGDTLPGDAKLEGIYAGRVLLSRAGVNESLALPRADAGDSAVRASAPTLGQSGPPLPSRASLPIRGAAAPFVTPSIAPGGPSLESFRAATGTDPLELAKQVQIFPVLENGRMAGVRLAAGRDSDLLSRAGIQPNDIVTAVNGIPLDGPQRSAELMTALKDARSVQVTVRRDGKDIQLTIGM